MKEYRVVVGINYPDPANPKREKRAERGDMVRDLPASAVPSLLQQGSIEELVDPASLAPAEEAQPETQTRKRKGQPAQEE